MNDCKKDKKRMSRLQPGEQGIVVGFELEHDLKRRLQDMGLVNGVCVECVGISPLGDPVAYLIKEAVIAIRRADSHHILMEPICGGRDAVQKEIDQ